MAPLLLLFGALLCLCLALGVEVAAQQPEVAYTKLTQRQGRLHSFANSTSALYVDNWVNGTIFVTHDEGKTWKEADLPSGVRKDVTLHPFDNRYAFVETHEGPYYRTSDRGVTWQSFEMPVTSSYSVDHFSFHSNPNSSGYILINGMRCTPSERTGQTCDPEYYYTRDAFSSEPILLLSKAQSCQFAHSSKEFSHEEPHDLIFCVVSDWSDRASYSSRLFASSDFFNNDKRVVNLGLGRHSYNVAEFSFVGKFAVVKLFTNSDGDHSSLTLLSSDLKQWELLRFSSLQDRDSSGSLLALTPDKLSASASTIGFFGTVYVSDANGNNFVESLKNVDMPLWFQSFEYDRVPGVDHIGMVNIISNPTEAGNSANEELRSRISFDDGSTWNQLIPSFEDASSAAVACDPAAKESCSLHLHRHSRSQSNMLTRRGLDKMKATSSPTPGVLIRVGSIGLNLSPYEECDTFISTDAGLSWKRIMRGPHKYEYADHGSLIVLVKDTDDTDEVVYSNDSGQSWNTFQLDHRLRPLELSVAPDSTSQKFLLIGRIAHEEEKDKFSGDVLTVFLDFAPTRGRKCTKDDFEQWYIQDNKSNGCILGRKEWYLRRKIGRDCYVGQTFGATLLNKIEETCPCTRADYECDFNYVKQGDVCVAAVPESIPPGACRGPSGAYMGPSGYRLIADNACDKRSGVIMDNPIQKDCAPPQLPEGEVAHKVFEFPAEVVQSEYLKESTTILVRLRDGTMWQSSNEGYTWLQLFPDERFLTLITHPYSPYRAYLLTKSNTYFYTTDAGRSWDRISAPLPPNTFGSPTLAFNPRWEYLIWVGDARCSGSDAANNCQAEAHYSLDHGRTWRLIESYVRHCAWARDEELKRDLTQIVCESYKEKSGNQRYFNPMTNPLQLVSGTQFYGERRALVQNVVGFVRLSDFLLVAEYQEHTRSIGLKVSRDGTTFSEAVFPRDIHPQNHAYTILDATSESIFMHLTTSENPNPYWGVILKSDSDGVVYVMSEDYVNRNDRGFVDFIKLPVLEGIALTNVIANPDDSIITGRKELLTRISHNAGGSWKPLTPPKKDSVDQAYLCPTNSCALHLHAFSERPNSRSSLDVPSRPELLISVGNVGEVLAPYKESDTFLSRDAGFTWSEIHKGTHVWASGDRGSLLVMARDSAATDRVVYSTDEGLSWREYRLKGLEKIRVRSIVTVPQDSSRRFILFGYNRQSMDAAVAIQLDFSFLTKKQCVTDEENPNESDFELWGPSDERQDGCLFGRQTLYQRRIRDRNCYIGDQKLLEERHIKSCACTDADFECEFNHVRDESGACVLVPGATSLSNKTFCASGEGTWHERTPYRKIGYSACEGGIRSDWGAEHECTEGDPEGKSRRGKHGWLFWSTVAYLSLALAALLAYVVFRCSGLARGKIRLAEEDATETRSKSSVLKALSAPPLFIGGFIVRASRRFVQLLSFRSRKSSQRPVVLGENAHLLNFEEERDS